MTGGSNNNISINLGRAIDGIHYTHALSTKTANIFHNTQHLDHRILFIFSKVKLLSFNNPKAEQWYTDIAGMVRNHTTGITTSEIKEAIHPTATLTSLTTNTVPSKSNSNLCSNVLVVRTLMTPIIKFNLSKVLKSKGNLLVSKYSNSSDYTLLSQDSIISSITTKPNPEKIWQVLVQK